MTTDHTDPAAAAALLHEFQAARFSRREGDALCSLHYRLEEERMVITETQVPPALRGAGRAAELVEAALAWARDEGLTVVADCTYVSAYLQRHVEHQDLRAA